jgi:hypothetical protein
MLAALEAKPSTICADRETANTRLDQRGLARQAGANPFFAGADYAADLIVRDAYLLPKDSNSPVSKHA